MKDKLSSSSYPPQPSETSDKNKGSFFLGLTLPFLILIIVYTVILIGLGIFSEISSTSGKPIDGIGPMFAIIGLGLLPLATLIGSIIYFVRHGKTRTVAGMAISSGLIILLMAACFGAVFINIY